jgi:hypothetical protein
MCHYQFSLEVRPHPCPLPWGEGEALVTVRVFCDRGLNSNFCNWCGERDRSGRIKPRPRGSHRHSDTRHRLVFFRAACVRRGGAPIPPWRDEADVVPASTILDA